MKEISLCKIARNTEAQNVMTFVVQTLGYSVVREKKNRNSALKKVELSSHENTWENLKCILLSERRASLLAQRVKNPLTSEGDRKDMSSVPGSGRSPGRGHGNLLKYACLENPMNREAWWTRVHGVAKSWTRLSDQHTHKRKKPI